MTYTIKTLNNISSRGLDLLPEPLYEKNDESEVPDAILLRSFNMHKMQIPDSLKAVGRAGAGVNNIPLDHMSENGVVVFNAPGANANAVKELVIAGMLMGCRNLIPGYNFAHELQGSDEDIHKQVETGKKYFGGFELTGKTLGVVGLGAIGVQVANAAHALGMNVIGYDPQLTVSHAWQLSSAVREAESMDEIFQNADFITFHVPLIDATRHLINPETITQMKDQVIILNFARNGIVDDQAVCEALDSGKVYAYICDFPSNLLKAQKRVLALPHLGASTIEAEEKCAVMVAEQIRDFLENGNIRNSVNFPRMKLPRKGVARISLLNHNVPGIVGQISNILGDADINIIQMRNESTHTLAYTLLDIESTLPDSVKKDLESIEGVLKLRII